MRHVVLGGGIAGVCCALELARCLRQQQDEATRAQSRNAHPPTPNTAAPDPDGDPEGDPTSAAPSLAGAGPSHSSGARSSPGQGDHVVLVSGSSMTKGVREVARLSRLVEEIEVVETPLQLLAEAEGCGGLLRVLHATVTGLDLQRRLLHLEGGGSLSYDKLCIATGARPKALDVPGASHPAVVTLRDTDSVQDLSRRLASCRRVVLVGNGGIALELAGALVGRTAEAARAPPPPPLPPPLPAADAEAAGSNSNSAAAAAGGGPSRELVWALKHGHIGDAFFDTDAAAFLLTRLAAQAGGATHGSAAADEPAGPAAGVTTRGSLATAAGTASSGAAAGGLESSRGGGHVGHAAGPMWTRQLMRGLAAAAARTTAGTTAGTAGAGERQSSEEGQGGGGLGAGARWDGSLDAESDRERGRGSVQEAAAAGRGAGGAAGACADTATAGEVGGCGAAPGAADAAAAVAAAPAARAGSRAGGEDRGGCGGGGGASAASRLVLEFSSVVERIDDGAAVEDTASGGGVAGPQWPAYVRLSNGKVYGTDLVVCGLGVEPATGWLPPELARAPDGGLAVDAQLRTSDPRVWAAGDCATLAPQHAGPHWFQMRLWTQARVMGSYAGQCMCGAADELASGFNFELFTHVTRFLGAKVVLLGLYNGQRLESEPADDIVMYVREGEAEDGSGPTFVRLLLLRGRLQGAVLIGETELEEALENLILDGLDISPYGPHILDPDFELEHIFD